MQRINIRVTPRAKQNKVVGMKNDMLRVHVTAVPEHGKANDALIKLLSKEWKIPKSQITIIRGETTREKVLEIPDGVPSLQKRIF